MEHALFAGVDLVRVDESTALALFAFALAVAAGHLGNLPVSYLAVAAPVVGRPSRSRRRPRVSDAGPFDPCLGGVSLCNLVGRGVWRKLRARADDCERAQADARDLRPLGRRGVRRSPARVHTQAREGAPARADLVQPPVERVLSAVRAPLD